MKKTLLIVATLLPATLIALLYAWLETSESRKSAAPERTVEERAADRTAAGPDVETAAADEVAASQEPGPTASSGPGDEAAHRDEVEGAPVELLRGIVRRPEGTPADEELEVLLLDSGDASRFAAQSSDAALAANPSLLARAPVAADGSFELPGRSSGWIALRGRYLHAQPLLVKGDSSSGIELKPYLGAWITGRVATPEGTPAATLEEVELELQPDPLAVAGSFGRNDFAKLEERKAEVASDGTFAFLAVAYRGPHLIRATCKTLAAHSTDLFDVAPGKHVDIDLALRRGGALAGRIVDEQGQPVAGAELEARQAAMMFGEGGFRLRKGESGEDGRFELNAVAEGEVELRVDCDGYLDARGKFRITEGARTDAGDFGLSRGDTVSGRVTWSDGRPAAGVRVQADFDPAAMAGMGAFNAMRGGDSAATSGEDGRFVVAGLGKGPFVVSVEASPPDERVKWRAKATGVTPGRDDLELVLAPPLSISGRVVDSSGAPVTKFQIVAAENLGGILGSLGGRRLVPETFEHAGGEFRIDDLTPGNWDLEPRAEGFARAQPTSVALSGSEADGIEIVLVRGATVRGVVLSSDGAPRAGASVREKLTLQALMRVRAEHDLEERVAVSRPDGTFELAGLAPGAVDLTAIADGFAESEPARVELVPDHVVEGVTLRLRTGGTITGEIYGPDGAPLAGAQILAQDAGSPGTPLITNADAAGRFEFEHVRPATYTVLNLPIERMREAPQGEEQADFTAMFTDMKMATAVVADGEETHVVLGAPPKDPVEISGRVLAGDRPVPKAIVTFVPDGQPMMSGLRFITTDEEGRYSTRLDTPGRYLASVQKQGAGGEQQTVSDVVDVPEEERFEHDLHVPLGSIRGRVLDAEGDPAAGVRISLMDDGPIPSSGLFGRHFAEITTGADGRYELIWLEPGRYTVVAGGPRFGGMFGDEGTSTGRQVRSGVEVRAEGDTDGVDFRLRKPGSLEGLVRGADGKPAAQASIFLRDDDGRLLERFSFVATDANGRFSYAGLEPGSYTAVARTAEAVSGESAPFTIREDQKSEIELALGPGTILLVTLSDDQGNPVECSLEVTDEQGRQVNGTLSMADMTALSSGGFSTREQRIGPLPPGKYRVIATTSDGRRANKPVTLSGQAERRLNVRF